MGKIRLANNQELKYCSRWNYGDGEYFIYFGSSRASH